MLRLRAAGCVAAEDEAIDLVEAAGGDPDCLEKLVARRCQGEPIAWLLGSVTFCGVRVEVHPGVYVPRWQSEPLALEAVSRLPDEGVAVDLCTGSGAIAVVLSHGKPRATVLATETDPRAFACAQANGVDVRAGDMAEGLPASLHGRVDVVTAVTPYVPTDAMAHLPRDVVTFEPRHALDGGPDGTTLQAKAVRQVASLLRPGGSLLLEAGGDQEELLAPLLAACGFTEVKPARDEDGDLRALYCRR